MNILMLSSDYLPNIGGIASHVFNLSKGLRDLGHNVAVANPREGVFRDVLVETESDVPVFRCHFKHHIFWPQRVVAKTRAAVAGIKQAGDYLGSVDIIHQHDYLNSALAARLKRGGRKWIWTNHTSQFVHDMEKWHRRRMLSLAFSAVDGVIAASSERLKLSRDLVGPETLTEFIPNGVDTARFSPHRKAERARYGIEENAYVVLCPSRMTEVKGVIYLAQAAKIIIEAAPAKNWCFVFVGSDPEFNTDVAYIQGVRDLLGGVTEGAIKFLGNVPPGEMPDINALADLVAMPSLMEAVSLSALEAMASGKALVASAVDGLAELVQHGENGFLVKPRDPQQLAAAITHARDNPKLCAQVAEAALSLVGQRYRWEAIAQRTEAFYSRVLQG